MIKYLISYTGDLAFIKPPFAHRCDIIRSQNYISPSNKEGIRRYLRINQIDRIKIYFEGITSPQLEVQEAKDMWNKSYKPFQQKNIIFRECLINPILYMLLPYKGLAERASEKIIYLSRTEDLMIPSLNIKECNDVDFSNLKGIECIEKKNGIPLGYNRYTKKNMYGDLIFND